MPQIYAGKATTQCQGDEKKNIWALEDLCKDIYCSNDINFLYFGNGTEDSLTKNGIL